MDFDDLDKKYNNLNKKHIFASVYNQGKCTGAISLHLDRIKDSVNVKPEELPKVEDYYKEAQRLILEYEQQMQKLTSEYQGKLNAITLEKSPLIFTEHIFGACKYPSIGHTQYCYLSFVIPMIHKQWIRLFFNKSCILLNQTLETIEKDRKNNWVNSDPPNCQIINEQFLQPMQGYLNENSLLLYGQAKNLPLTINNIKENAELCCMILRKVKNAFFVPILQSELYNPTEELWLALRIPKGSYNQRVLGFTKKVDLTGQIHKLVESTHFLEQPRGQLAISGLKRYYHNKEFYVFELAGSVEEKDQYLQKVFEDTINRIKNGIIVFGGE